ncbi:MAG TPA: GNAT family N-acetyltransferase [Haloplasmataceae bacterium]
MPDLLVNLYDLPETYSTASLKEKGVHIVRALTPDKHRVEAFIRETFNEGWVSEAAVALSKVNPTIFIATKDKKIVGFACYDATAKGYFGPTGVDPDYRGLGIGTALLMKCLIAMREEGYGYAIIGGAGPVEYYKKVCGAIIIPSKDKGIYKRLVHYHGDFD